MSAIAQSETTVRASAPSSFARVPAAFKLQFTVPSALVWIPLMVFFGAWAISVGIGLWIEAAGADFTAQSPFYSGASQAAVWCLLFIGAYAASHTFSFAMALSFSRRVYIFGVLLAFGLVSVAYGVLFGLLAALEQATDGLGGHFYTFALPFLVADSGAVGAGALAAALCLAAMLFGFFWAILYRRVSVMAVTIVALTLGVVILAAVMLVTTNGWWPEVGEWVMNQSALSGAGWFLIPIVGLILASYAIIRRATP